MFGDSSISGKEFRARHGVDRGAFVVGYAGTLGAINGVSYLVELASRLRAHTHIQFVIVGDGQEREKIEGLARERGCLGRNVVMTGRVAKQEMPEVLAAMDVCTSLFLPIPAMQANSANKFFDALAAGRCVAINYSGWHADLIEGAGVGIRLSDNIEVAAQQVAELSGDTARVRRMGINARALAEREFSRDVLAKRLERVLVEARGAA
jgi:glycosyltransferase involved in cell wall biosynthesis